MQLIEDLDLLFVFNRDDLKNSDEDLDEEISTEQKATDEVSSTSEEETSIDGESTRRNQFEFEDADQAEAEVYCLLKVA